MIAKKLKPTILYVEDEEGVRTQLVKFLKNLGSEIFVAVDGKDGLEEYKKHNPDIVISDIKMPNMDGIDMVQTIKEIDKNQPIIFTTAFSNSGFFMDAIDLGVDGYILKPIDLEKLKNKIEHISYQVQLQKQFVIQEKIMDEITQFQDNLLLVLDKNINIIFCNRKFLNFFQIDSVENFRKKYKCVCSLFIHNDDFYYTPSGVKWIEEIKKLPDNKRVVLLKDLEDATYKSFLVNIKFIQETNHNVISFVEVTNIAIEQKEYKHRAFVDELTQIYNRAYFDEALKKEIAIYKREKTPFCLFMFDIDKFKDVNDTYGHQVGDEVLKELAKLTTKYTRVTDTFARWGGEEFMRILPNNSIEQSIKIADNIRQIIENHSFVDGLKVTCSFGVSEFKDDDTGESLLKRVDDALYMAKENGRNRVEGK